VGDPRTLADSVGYTDGVCEINNFEFFAGALLDQKKRAGKQNFEN